MYKIIHDEEQVRKFYRECLPRLKPTEVYFLSMAARNKYLTDEERKRYDLGRTEMYAKTIIRHDTEEEFLKHIRRLECDERGYTTRTGEPIPQKCMVCYVNIDPSSTPKALAGFTKVLGEYQEEALSIAVNKTDNSNFLDRLNKIDNNLMTCYQQAHAKGLWVDIDIDLEYKREDDALCIPSVVERHLAGYSLDYKIISTKSGFHVLLARKGMKSDPQQIAESLGRFLLDLGFPVKESVINKNRMIPLPGSWQCEYLVRFVGENK